MPMSGLIYNDDYLEDVMLVASTDYPWENLYGKSVVISGATGLIGSFLVDVLIYRKTQYGMSCSIYTLGRNEKRAKERFDYCWDEITFVPFDVNINCACRDIETADYVMHLASNTHPAAYATDPIGTIMTNVLGTYNMLELANEYRAKRCVFASSVEVYGENRGDIELFDESYCGYTDCNTIRAGYPESKRCGEALCQAYIQHHGLDIVIPRFARTYGPTMHYSDTKAISQFIKNAVKEENIVLKSNGTQEYSFSYVADAVSGLLAVFFYGQKGEAYNIADTASNIRLVDLASLIARESNKKVVFEKPDTIEQIGYSKATKAIMSSKKLQALGWSSAYDIKTGIHKTVSILKQIS